MIGFRPGVTREGQADDAPHEEAQQDQDEDASRCRAEEGAPAFVPVSLAEQRLLDRGLMREGEER